MITDGGTVVALAAALLFDTDARGIYIQAGAIRSSNLSSDRVSRSNPQCTSCTLRLCTQIRGHRYWISLLEA